MTSWNSRCNSRTSLLVFAWIAILAVGTTLRGWQLSLQLLADDEWHALNKIQNSSLTDIFLSFGQADHSIPLTLFYAISAIFFPINEFLLRLPLLIAGIVMIVAIPWMLRQHLSRHEHLWLASLLCLSPILVYFSRTARPYALTTLLAFAALLFFYRWFESKRKSQAMAYIALATLCAWLQPVTLSILITPFIFFGMYACHQWITTRSLTNLAHLLLLGIIFLLALSITLGPPMVQDYTSLAIKAGVNNVNIQSLYVSIQLLVGSHHGIFIIIGTAICLVGVYVLFKRYPLFTCYLLFASVFTTVAIILSRASWIHHPLVTARYALPVLPIILLFLAVGLNDLVRRLSERHTWIGVTSSIFILAAIYFSGPLPRQYHHGINQFTGHMAHQFDYDWTRNVYNEALNNRPISPFYQSLGNEDVKRYHLVVTPWFMEWHWNRWYLDQAVHQQRVSAGFLNQFCLNEVYGEYPATNQQIHLKQIKHLSNLTDDSPGDSWMDVDFLVYHKTKPRPELDIKIPHQCLTKLRDILGESHYEDDILVVFKLKP